MHMRLISSLALFLFAAIGPARAQELIGHETIYEGPTDVNLGGRPVVADIALLADMRAAERGILRVALVTDVTEFIEQTEQDLENWIAARHDDCGERWAAGEPFIGFPEGAIRFAIDLELEYWTCGWQGKSAPSRLAHEAGSVDVTLDPYVEDGKLQARLGDFSIDDRSGVSKYLPLEFVVRRVLDAELKKLNDNPKFYRAPKPFIGEGFEYESIIADKTANGRVVITARYRGRGSAETFERLANKVAGEGITQ